jgi:hypothetical protein
MAQPVRNAVTLANTKRCVARAGGLVHVPLYRRLESFAARMPERLLLEVAGIQWWPWLTLQPTGRICASALAVA